MQLIKGLLLEDPRALWIALGIAEIIVLVVWRRRRGRAALIALFVLPAVGVLLGLLDAAVETDREAVRRSIRMIGRAARSNNGQAVLERISPDYASGPYRKKDLAALVTFGLPQVTVRTPFPAKVTMEGDRAEVRHTYRIDSRSGVQFQIHDSVTWEAVFAEDDDGEWRLRQVLMVEPFQDRPEKYTPRFR